MCSLFSCLLQQQLTQKQHLTVEAVGDPVSSLVLLLGELEAASPTRAIILIMYFGERVWCSVFGSRYGTDKDLSDLRVCVRRTYVFGRN